MVTFINDNYTLLYAQVLLIVFYGLLNGPERVYWINKIKCDFIRVYYFRWYALFGFYNSQKWIWLGQHAKMGIDAFGTEIILQRLVNHNLDNFEVGGIEASLARCHPVNACFVLLEILTSDQYFIGMFQCNAWWILTVSSFGCAFFQNHLWYISCQW